MPSHKIKEQESKQVGTATFNKADDYKAVTLTSDPLSKPRLLHKVHADKLIELGRAKVAKDVKSEAKPVTMTVTPEPKAK